MVIRDRQPRGAHGADMTRTTNARIAGVAFLFYIAAAFPSMVLFAIATNAVGTTAKLARIADHVTELRVTVVLSVFTCFAALVLAVTLYRITRDEDRDLAMLGMTCRVGEGVLNAISILAILGLLWLGTVTGADAPDADAARALGGLLLKMQIWGTAISATFFAVGSTLFAYLLLRGRMIPGPLAWLGVIGSALLVLVLPLQLAGFLDSPLLGLAWFPVGVFELVVAPWLIIKGVATAT
jgi:hypothetical protein